MAVTMSDIAERVGVDKSTISLVLSNKIRPVKISEATRKRVIDAAKEMNYRPNLLARGLITGKTRSIGVIVCRGWYEVMRKKVERLHDLTHEKEYSFSLSLTNPGVENELAAIAKMRERKVDGLIISTHATISENDHFRSLDEEGFPYVLFDSGKDPTGMADCFVSLDRVEAGRIATGHLLELGHRRIGYLLPKVTQTTHQKVEGYRDTMIAKGLEPVVFEGTDVLDRATYETGYEIVMTNAEAVRRMTALFAYNDRIAVGAIRALKELGIEVPADMAVVGFDNDDVGTMTIPKLSTIAPPIEKLAQTTIDLLFERIKAGRKHMTRKILLKPELIVRESSGGKIDDF